MRLVLVMVVAMATATPLDLRVGQPCGADCAARERFARWAAAGGAEGAGPLLWRSEGVAAAAGGAGVFAAFDGRVQRLGCVPRNLTLSRERLLALRWWQGLEPVQDELLYVATYLMHERFVAKGSGPFGPYVMVLPGSARWAPCMWSDDDVAFAKEHAPLLHDVVVAEREAVNEGFAVVQQFVQGNASLWPETVGLHQFCWAHSMYASRFFGGVDSQGHSYALMVPFLDLFNHRFSDGPLHGDVVHDDRFCIDLLQDNDFAAGQEIFLTYGVQDVDQFVVHLGFLPNVDVEAFNTFVRLEPAHSDPLRALKARAIAQCWPNESAAWVSLPMDGIPEPVFQRAQVLAERRAALLRNATRWCRPGGAFADRDVHSLRRNKRALLRILRGLRLQPDQRHCRTDTQCLLARYAAAAMENRRALHQRFVQGTYRVMRQ